MPFRFVFGKVERRLGCRTSRFLISFPACKKWKEHWYNIHFSFFETSVELKIQAFWNVRCIGWFEVPYFFYLQCHLSKQTSVTLPVDRTKHARRPVCSNTETWFFYNIWYNILWCGMQGFPSVLELEFHIYFTYIDDARSNRNQYFNVQFWQQILVIR
jgi:hypothetical protein